MKFETLILRSLFIACMAVCGLIFGAMVMAKPAALQLASSHAASSLLRTPSTCALPADGVLCPLPRG